MITLQFEPQDIPAVKLLFAEGVAFDFSTQITLLQQILANQQTMQGSITSEGVTLAMITDQITQLDQLETQEHQAIIDAAKRVDDKLTLLVQDNPQLATTIGSVQTDIANLANIAAASGTGAPVPVLPPVTNPGTTPATPGA